MIPALRIAALSIAAVSIAGCGAVKPSALPQAGRVKLELPPGEWVDLGPADPAFTAQPAPPSPALQTHALALRGAGKEPLAVVLVQANLQGDPRQPSHWTAPCPEQRGVLVQNASGASPLRIDCLRYKPWADNHDWLRQNYPQLAGWLAGKQVVPSRPYAHLNYRFSTETGAWVSLHVLADQRLLIPPTRSTDEFLRAGLPGQAWSQAVVRAVRTSTGMLDGYLALPPFPMPAPR